MAAVRLMPPPRQDFALGDWLFPGIVLALSMVLLPLIGKDVDFLKSLFGSGYSFVAVLGAGCGLHRLLRARHRHALDGAPGLPRETRPDARAEANGYIAAASAASLFAFFKDLDLDALGRVGLVLGRDGDLEDAVTEDRPDVLLGELSAGT